MSKKNKNKNQAQPSAQPQPEVKPEPNTPETTKVDKIKSGTSKIVENTLIYAHEANNMRKSIWQSLKDGYNQGKAKAQEYKNTDKK